MTSNSLLLFIRLVFLKNSIWMGLSNTFIGTLTPPLRRYFFIAIDGDITMFAVLQNNLSICLAINRPVLALILMAKLQITGIILAYFVGLLSKDIAAYFVNHKVCFPQRFYFWQSLAAPILAGTSHYFLLRWVTGFIWKSDQVTSIIIFFIGVLPSFPVFMFFYGLFGGWDSDTLAELKQAADLTGFVRPLAWVMWASSALGARISPLNNRFPITNRLTAMEEARQLTAEKVKL